ncbi:metal-dependent hydrolase [Alkanindiges illinoisensis]|uniref:metal-dependent hydrolase n=1 Tax=Alkanindiges illinoisensis TaxID=197183 RepID=UPI00047DEB13|nr:metal-dependent hydrolase [Alkanindiges illinoisensis]
MPFTPIHFGAGLAAKAIGQRQFSLMIFAGSQVLMDIEPLLGIIYGWPVLHRISHTLGGALLVGTIAALIGKPVSQWMLRCFRYDQWSITWQVSFISAYVGTFSHIALDAIMHSDMNPFWPLLRGNPWLGIITINQLHLLCLVLGMIGGIMIAVQKYRQKSAVKSA